MAQGKKEAAAEAKRLRLIQANEARVAAEEAWFTGRPDPDKGLALTPDIIAFWYRSWLAWRSASLGRYFFRASRKCAKRMAFPEFMNHVAFEAYRTSGLLLGAGMSPTEVLKAWHPLMGEPGAFSYLLTNERVWFFDGSSHRCFALDEIRTYKPRFWLSFVLLFSDRACRVVLSDTQGKEWTINKLGHVPSRAMLADALRIGPVHEPPEGRAERGELTLTSCGVRCPRCETDVRVVVGRMVVLCPQCRTLIEQCPKCSSPKLQASKTDMEQLVALAPGLLGGGLIGGLGGQMVVYAGIEAANAPGGSMRRCETCAHQWKA